MAKGLMLPVNREICDDPASLHLSKVAKDRAAEGHAITFTAHDDWIVRRLSHGSNDPSNRFNELLAGAGWR